MQRLDKEEVPDFFAAIELLNDFVKQDEAMTPEQFDAQLEADMRPELWANYQTALIMAGERPAVDLQRVGRVRRILDRLFR